MSYSLKNRAVVIIALAFTAMIITSRIGHTQAAPAGAPVVDAPIPAPISEDIDIFGLDEDEGNNPETPNPMAAPNAPKPGEVAPQMPQQGTVDDFLSDVSENAPMPEAPNGPASMPGAPNGPAPMPGAPNGSAPDPNGMATNGDLLNDKGPVDMNPAMPPIAAENKPQEEKIPVTEAPKSPFESFGNAILSKVDNDLFNQMSNIEKQTTILNLELKREELKNRVEALRAARARAAEEEEERRRDAEEKRKEREAERQARILAEQEKLKQREIELEKVRQARVLNEYMNEMLMINQQWVEKNTALQTRIHDLEKERIDLIKDFEKKSGEVYREISSVRKRAEMAVSAHERIVTSMNAQITQLRKSVIENEDRYKKLKEGNNANPFASTGMGALDEDAVDMSKEYAIMDITGKGDNIIAKIVNSEGTTFIVHKGSMLKGGEVVTAITDNYIAFDNKGIKSYLYTGGTVMEFEPTVSFNDSEKMPEETEKMSIKTDVRNVLGQAQTNSGSIQGAKIRTIEKSSSDAVKKSSTHRKSGGATPASAGSGMFMQ